MEQSPRRINEYQYNPIEQTFEPTQYLGQGLGTGIESLTNGRYTIWSNGTVFDTSTNQIVTVLPSNRVTILTQFFGNEAIPELQHTELQVQVPLSEVNRRFYAGAGHAIGASFDAVTSNGIEYHFDLDYGKIAPPGKILITNGGEIWRDSYRWVNYYEGINDNAVNGFHPGFRIATTDEATEYMLRGMIFSKYGQMIQDMLDNGMVDEFGNELETVSDAVAYLVRLNQKSVEAARYTYLAT